MEAPRQSDNQTNGDISDSEPKSTEDSPEHIISNTESVSTLFDLVTYIMYSFKSTTFD